MTRRLMTLVAALVMGGSALVVGPAGPAAAESGDLTFERGDAPAAIDIVGLHVTSGAKRFTMQATVVHLKEKGTFHFHYWRGRHQSRPPQSLILLVRRVDERTKARFLECGREDCVPTPCKGLRAEWDPATDVVEASAPHACYPRRAGTAPPREGRFSVWSSTPRNADEARGHLLLRRG
ncbi:MAG: hypothetical protein U0R80_20405 [Nocardioidaceae bacterium]